MRRLLVPLIITVILVGVGFVLGITYSGSGATPESASIPQLVTVQLVVTATVDANATVPVRIITATPPPGSIGALPTGILQETDDVVVDSTRAAAPTLDPVLLGADSALQETVSALPEDCILHTITEGDTPFAIAEVYGVSGFDLMEVNGLDDEAASRLQIGDVLIVPLEGCSLTAADLAASQPDDEEVSDATEEAESTAETTAEAAGISLSPTVRPTITLPPTAVNAQVEIVQVIGAGDVTAEAVEIRNTGGVVDMTGWTLSDSEGNVYTFPEQRLFTNGSVTVYTRRGTDTPIARFWGRSDAVWGDAGESVTLTDSRGDAQSVLRLETTQTLP